ncbi:uncharacterized protein METZ01_LOCUS229798, partial [marine metagenome]
MVEGSEYSSNETRNEKVKDYPKDNSIKLFVYPFNNLMES